MMGQTVDLNKLCSFAKKIILDAGEYIKEAIQSNDFQIDSKTSPTDLVTRVDREVEQKFIEWILKEYPTHTILGEEGQSREDQNAEYRWIIDPIDGTTNFIHQKINFCISVGIYRKNEGLIGIIYDPIREEMFWAIKGQGAYLNDQRIMLENKKTLSESLISTNLIWVNRTRKWGLEQEIFQIARSSRGIRSLGSAALELAYVASGRLDAFLSLHLSPWDYAGGQVILEEAGGKICDFKGNPLPMQKEKIGLLASHPAVHEEILQILKDGNEIE